MNKKGPFEKTLDNITSGKSYFKAQLNNKKEAERLSQNVDQLGKDITDYIVKNGYDYLFKTKI